MKFINSNFVQGIGTLQASYWVWLIVCWWSGSCIVMKHFHDDIKWKCFPRYWPFARGIHGSPVNSPHRGQWHGASMFPLICAWINGWVNNREAGDLRCHHTHYDVTVMLHLHLLLLPCIPMSLLNFLLYGNLKGPRFAWDNIGNRLQSFSSKCWIQDFIPIY